MQHPDEGTIHAWLDGALDDAEAAALEAHVATCAPCRALVAEARGLIAGASRVLGALDDVPAGVIPAAPDESRPADVVPLATRQAARAPRRLAGRPAVRIAAALVVVAGGAAALARGGGGAREAMAPEMIAPAAPMAANAMDSAAAAPAPAPAPTAAAAQPADAPRAAASEERLAVAAQAPTARRTPQKAVAAPPAPRPAARMTDSLPAEPVVVAGMARDNRPGHDASLLEARPSPSAPSAPSAVAQAAPPTVASAAPPPAPAANAMGQAAERREADRSLATRAKAFRARAEADAMAGTCLVVTLRASSASGDDVRTTTVTLLPDSTLAFPRQAEGLAEATGTWAADTSDAAHPAVRLRWTQGVQQLSARLAWGEAPMQGLGAVRIGRVGVDAVASAVRVNCATVR